MSRSNIHKNNISYSKNLNIRYLMTEKMIRKSEMAENWSGTRRLDRLYSSLKVSLVTDRGDSQTIDGPAR